MVRAYGQAWRRLEAQLTAITGKIAEAQAEGKPLGVSWLFQQHRLEALLAATEGEVRKFADYASATTKQGQLKAVVAAANHAHAAVLSGAGHNVASGFARLPTGAVEHLVGHLADGSPLSALFDQLAPAASAGIRSVLVTGLATGRNPREIAAAAKQHLGGNLVRALTIARTETLRAYREATRLQYQHNDDVVGGWVWVSAHDNRTCPACWAMHGTRHGLEERLDGHPNCRCVMVPITRTYEEILAAAGKGAAGAEADAISPAVKITPGAELFAKLEAEDQQRILGPAKYALYASGAIELSDVAQQADGGAWGTMRREASVAEALANAEARKAAAAAHAAQAELLQAIAAHAATLEAQAAADAAAHAQAAVELEAAQAEALSQHKVEHTAQANLSFPTGTSVAAAKGKHAGKVGVVVGQAGGFVKVDFGDGAKQTVWKAHLEHHVAAPAPTAAVVSTANGSDVLAVLGKHAGKKGTVASQAGGFVKVDFGDGKPVMVWKAHLAHPSANAEAAAEAAKLAQAEHSKKGAKGAQAKANAAPVTTQKAQPAPTPGTVDVDKIAAAAVAVSTSLEAAATEADAVAYDVALKAGFDEMQASLTADKASDKAKKLWHETHAAASPAAAVDVAALVDLAVAEALNEPQAVAKAAGKTYTAAIVAGLGAGQANELSDEASDLAAQKWQAAHPPAPVGPAPIPEEIGKYAATAADSLEGAKELAKLTAEKDGATAGLAGVALEELVEDAVANAETEWAIAHPATFTAEEAGPAAPHAEAMADIFAQLGDGDLSAAAAAPKLKDALASMTNAIHDLAEAGNTGPLFGKQIDAFAAVSKAIGAMAGEPTFVLGGKSESELTQLLFAAQGKSTAHWYQHVGDLTAIVDAAKPPAPPVPAHVAAAAASIAGPLEEVLVGLETGADNSGQVVSYETAAALQQATKAYVDQALNGPSAHLADYKPLTLALKDVVAKNPADFAALEPDELAAHLGAVAEDMVESDVEKAQAAVAQIKAMAAQHAATPAPPQPAPGFVPQGPLHGKAVIVDKGKQKGTYSGLVGKVVQHQVGNGADVAHVYFPATGKTAKIVGTNLAVAPDEMLPAAPAPAVAPATAPATPSTAAAAPPAPAAKKAPKTPAVEPKLEPRTPPVDLAQLVADTTESSGLAGAHAKTVYRAPDGSLWMFKPQDAFRAELDSAMGRLAQVAGFGATPHDVFNVELHGQRGSLQRLIAGKDDRRAAFGKHGAFDPSKLDSADAEAVQKHAVFNWLIGNHDGHVDQFVRRKGDRTVHQVDLGQAFKFIGKDKLDHAYNPNPVPSVANQLYEQYAKGKDVQIRTLTEGNAELKGFIEKLQGIDDGTYRAVLRPYAEQAAAKGMLATGATFKNDVEKFLDAAVDRKNGLLDDWTAYHGQLEAARAKVAGQVPTGNDAFSAGAIDFSETGDQAAHRWMLKKWPAVANSGITSDEEKALRSYKGSGYQSINTRLRNQMPPTPTITAIDTALTKNPMPDDTIVWRGTSFLQHKPEDYVGKALPYHDGGYMSTSLGSTPAFSSETYYLRLRCPKGMPTYALDHLGIHVGERELLLPRGCKGFVTRVWKKPRAYGGEVTVLDVKIESWGQPAPP